jgi:hypothetical protein
VDWGNGSGFSKDGFAFSGSNGSFEITVSDFVYDLPGSFPIKIEIIANYHKDPDNSSSEVVLARTFYAGLTAVIEANEIDLMGEELDAVDFCGNDINGNSTEWHLATFELSNVDDESEYKARD